MPEEEMAQSERMNRRNASSGSLFRRMLRSREVGVLLALILLVAIMAVLTPYFLKPDNLFNVLRGMSTIGIMAIGQTMIIITGGIDLSVGSVLAASSMMTARLMFTGVPPWIAVALGLGFGTLLGSINGLLITRVKIPPFIATLGMLSIARGLAYLLASGLEGTVASNVPMRDEAVNFLGKG